MEHGFGDAESILQNLKDLPIIPLADGSVVTLNGEGVFFPVEETKTKKKKAQGQTGNSLLKLFMFVAYYGICCIKLHVFSVLGFDDKQMFSFFSLKKKVTWSHELSLFFF